MQIKIYKENDLKDKLKTRKLYEENFDIGKKDFVDYYYDAIIKRNEIVALEDDDGKVVSMIHLNPYLYDVMGHEVEVHYLVAVATDENYRGNGYMKQLLEFSIKYLKEIGDAFLIIVPDNERLMKAYESFGFEKVGIFNIDKFSNEKYEIFPVRNSEFSALMEKEKYFLDFETEEYINDLKQKVVMVNILNYDLMPCKSKTEFKSKSIYVCEEV